ncbi:hypothetical protein FQR65_LT20008 [Abscondita terminalis]|nr:hypothetical protein FQR65_LT20008 [Abscondita terminalis]
MAGKYRFNSTKNSACPYNRHRSESPVYRPTEVDYKMCSDARKSYGVTTDEDCKQNVEQRENNILEDLVHKFPHFVLVKHSELLRALAKLGNKERLALLKCADDKQVHCICECVYNTLKGKIPLSRHQKLRLTRHKHILRRLVKPGEPIKKKKQMLVQQGGAFLPLLIAPLLSGVISSIFG